LRWQGVHAGSGTCSRAVTLAESFSFSESVTEPKPVAVSESFA
jgi:hypothetical protein